MAKGLTPSDHLVDFGMGHLVGLKRFLALQREEELILCLLQMNESSNIRFPALLIKNGEIYPCRDANDIQECSVVAFRKKFFDDSEIIDLIGLRRRAIKVKIAHVNKLKAIGMRLIGRIRVEIQWSAPFGKLSFDEIGVIVLRFLQQDESVDKTGACRLKGCATIEDLIKIAADTYFGE